MIKDAKLLYVDLNTKTTEVKTLDAETYRKYPGGSALGMYIILKEMDPRVDPLSPENMLIFTVSPLTGIPISGQSRMCATTKSPLTGTVGDSQVGGFIPAVLKANGWDGIVLKGRAETPVYLYIEKDKVEIRDASGLWGMITGDAEKAIVEELGHTRFEASINGSAGCVDGHAAEGFLPSYNWEKGIMDDWIKTAGTTITKTVLKHRETCFGCAIRCKGVVDIPGKADPEYGGPEYETCATFGSYCGNTDLGEICHANQLCNMFGLDTITCGATIAWAMDCFERGILTEKETDGLELKFGNGAVFDELIKKIARKEPGIGELLAKGSAAAAKELGPEAEDLVVACKGQEWPAHMVRFKPNLALNYAANPFGADHQSSEHDPALMAPDDDQNWIWPNMLDTFEKCDRYGVLDNNKARFAYTTQKFYAMMDTLCLCQFAWGPAWQLYGPQDLIDFCKYGIGWETSVEELQEIGERRINMMRLFNQKLGYSRKDDTLPKKAFLPVEIADGEIAQITPEQFEETLTEYYRYAFCGSWQGDEPYLHEAGSFWGLFFFGHSP